MVLRSFDNKISIFELCRLNYTAGAAYAQAALELMEKARVKPQDLEVIGFDGQTIYQEPPDYEGMAKLKDPSNLVAGWFNGAYACGLQIGEPAVMAEACDTVTITHFRTMDHALGGTGAPLRAIPLYRRA